MARKRKECSRLMAKPKKITGAELLGYRQALNFSQSQLAKLLGVPRGTVASWESGRGVVPPALRAPLVEAKKLAKRQAALLSGALTEAPASVGGCWT